MSLPPDEQPSPPCPLRILLAEDSVLSQKIALLLLERQGYHVDCATTGCEVLAALQCQQYDAILMDVHMPDMDGLQTTQYIHEHGSPPHPYIIGMTADASPNDREHYLSHGMNDYLSKPLQPEELIHALERVRRISRGLDDRPQM